MLGNFHKYVSNTSALKEMKFDGIHCYAYFLMILMIFGMIALMHACKLYMFYTRDS